MKNVILLLLSFCVIPLAFAQKNVVSNDYFTVNFVDLSEREGNPESDAAYTTSSWGQYNTDTAINQVKAGIQNTIDYWASLLGENHRPQTGGFPSFGGQELSWERRVTIDFEFAPTASVARATVLTYDYSDSNFSYPTLTTPNGNSYDKVSGAELKLKTGYNFPISLANNGRADIGISLGAGQSFSFASGAVPEAFDFESIFLHEMTHGMGFESDAYTSTGYNGASKTAYDASMGNIGASPGSALNVTDENGDTVATLRNPDGGFEQGEDIVHIDDPNSVMYYTTSAGAAPKREFTQVDLDVLAAMGWDLTTTPAPPAGIIPTDLSEQKFMTQGGSGHFDVYTLTGLTVADGKINGSLTLTLDMTSEQIKAFNTAYLDGEIIGFELAGIKYDALEGFFYNDIVLMIEGDEYEVLGLSMLADGTAVLFIPEPSSVSLGMLGLVALLMRRRRRC